LQALKAEDRTEARLFESVLQVRAVEERGKTATARMKAERSRQARRGAAAASPRNPVTAAAPTASVPSLSPHAPQPPAVIDPFTDVEDL